MDTKNKYYAVCLRLNEKYDADIIAFLQGKRKQTLIKYLIREHMREEGFTVKGVY